MVYMGGRLYVQLHWDFHGLHGWKTLCPTSLGFCPVLCNSLSHTLCQTPLGFVWFTWVQDFISNFIGILSCTVLFIMTYFMSNFIGIFMVYMSGKLYVQLHWDFVMYCLIHYPILYVKLHWDLNGSYGWKTLCPTSFGFSWFTWVEDFMSNFIGILSCTV